MRAVDIDKDDKLVLLISSPEAQAIELIGANGGNFLPAKRVGFTVPALSVDAADYSLGGNLDLSFASFWPVLGVLPARSSNFLPAPFVIPIDTTPSYFTSFYPLRLIKLPDLNGDGLFEFATVDINADPTIYVSSLDGSYSGGSSYSGGDGACVAVTAGEFYGEGAPSL